jgi:hypothetical protein
MSSKVITPGRSLVKAAQALEDPRRMLGTYPYQWSYPGPHSKHVLANDSIAIPVMGAGPAQVLSYEVPAGLRFSLRGIVFGFVGTGWNEGTGDLLFTLECVDSGQRAVDFLQNVKTHLGSADFPYPILGRLEFAPDSVLLVTANNVGVTVTGVQSVYAHLVGHTYPNAES